MPEPGINELIDAELGAFATARADGNRSSAWHSLERAHILSQARLRQHLRVHVAMLGYAVVTRDPREGVGQLFRLLLAPIGHLTGRTPVGNTGRSNVGAFRPMPIPHDLRSVLERTAR